MAKQSKPQKETVERVMHEFKHGELRIRGAGPKVKNPKQAIAIALHEAGASKQKSPKKNRENLSKTKARERRGETASKSRNSKSVPGKKAASNRGRVGAKVSTAGRSKTRAELYAEAKRRNVTGRSKMSKAELERALHA